MNLRDDDITHPDRKNKNTHHKDPVPLSDRSLAQERCGERKEIRERWRGGKTIADPPGLGRLLHCVFFPSADKDLSRDSRGGNKK